MPDLTSRLSLPSPKGTESADAPTDFRALTAILDNAAIYGQGVLASRPVSTAGTPGIAGRLYLATDRTPSPGILYLDYGTGWVALNAVDQAAGVGSQRTLGTGAGQALPGDFAGLGVKRRQSHSFTMDDTTSPGPGTVLGSFFIDPAAGETVTLVEAVTHCVSVGGTPSVLKVRWDHPLHGTLADVPGLTALTPSSTATALTATGSPLALSPLDRICVVVVTPGSSLGVTVQITTEHSA